MQSLSQARHGGCVRCGLRALRHVVIVVGIMTMLPLVLPGLARAQPRPPAIASSSGGPAEKSPATALNLALLGTGTGFGMMVAGGRWKLDGLSLAGFAVTLIGPSAGHFYAGENGRGLAHTGLRVSAVAAILVGAVWGLGDCLGDTDEDTCDLSPGATAAIAGGVVVGLGSMVYSLYDAPRAARRHNARARQLYVVPAPMAGTGQSSGFGLQLGGRF